MLWQIRSGIVTDTKTWNHLIKKNYMNTIQKFTRNAVVAAILLGLGACAGMSRQGQNTAIGAGAGALGGAVLTNGSGLGTVGGAAVGGIIGHEVRKPDRR